LTAEYICILPTSVTEVSSSNKRHEKDIHVAVSGMS